MGRKHRPYFRICAVDSRRPRDGRVLEELGTYDPMVPDTDARVLLNADRVSYWLGVGAQPSVKVNTFIKKYGASGTHLAEQEAARQRLSMPKVVPPAPEPVFIPKKGGEPEAAAPESEGAPAGETAQAEGASESSGEAAAE